jgi:gamma-glutamyl-gamma-aminobutyrate hydrolase PuuD
MEKMKEQEAKEAWDKRLARLWEEANSFHEKGVNPLAFKLGADAVLTDFQTALIEALENKKEDSKLAFDPTWRLAYDLAIKEAISLVKTVTPKNK